AGLVSRRVHVRGYLRGGGQGEADVHAIGHLVGRERAPDLRDDLRVGGNRLEGQRLGRAPQPGQVLRQPEDPALVDPQALPHCGAALEGGVERADRGLVPVRQPPADTDDQSRCGRQIPAASTVLWHGPGGPGPAGAGPYWASSPATASLTTLRR